MRVLTCFIIVLNFISFSYQSPPCCTTTNELPIKTSPGNPLILTPLIRQNKIEEARKAAEVTTSELKRIKSYSGYFTVNKEFNSNLFFWFFPSETNCKDAPVILWLQGGPGASSLFGLFTENGPFRLENGNAATTVLRTHSWTKQYSVIYMDSPVGSGFSFTNDGGWAKNQSVVGEQLYIALQQFFQMFPDLRKNDFFVSGQSYAGKYVPTISYTIHKKNPKAKLKINLKGFTIGNGACDPENQLKYAEYFYQLGLIDTNTKKELEGVEERAVRCIRKKQWLKAAKVADTIFGRLSRTTSLFTNMTGYGGYFNLLQTKNTENYDFIKFVQRPDIRAAIHAGNREFQQENPIVAKNMAKDIMQSVAPLIGELLGHYRVLFYNGQLDLVGGYPLTVNFLKNLNFSSADLYQTAKRHQWYVNSELAGYVKQAGNLTEVLVRNAGHFVPNDQPVWTLDLLARFTKNAPFY